MVKGIKEKISSIIYEEIPLKELTPLTAFERIRGGRYSFLLESASGPMKTGRYSFIGTDPYIIFKSKGREIKVIRDGKKTIIHDSPLKKLRELIGQFRIDRIDGLPPFIGGAIGILNYDFVHHFERLPRTTSDDLTLPEAHFIFIDTIIAFDHYSNKAWVITNPWVRNEDYEGVMLRIEEIIERLLHLSPSFPHKWKKRPIEIKKEIKKNEYESMVRKAKEYIAAGDIFQANLSQRLSAEIGDLDPWRLYRILRDINPSPFASFLEFDGYHIVSSSPERLLKVESDMVETRPIAGTRPRGKDPAGDREMRIELLLNEKERAEHIMLIDLERNDLGRVCDYGSIEVDELMVTEDYSHVIHIVSNIKGRLAKGKDCFDVIRAAFPGGTITGVPKVRCMEIIDELEPVSRGPYTGSIGYISFTGDMDLNIVIRTFVIKDGVAYVQAGAGIVADSDPEREYYETLYKAEALIKTIERI
jgi:aminodeoxychorismate synthase component I